MWIYIAHCHKVSNALGTLVPAEKPSFHTLSEGLIVITERGYFRHIITHVLPTYFLICLYCLKCTKSVS